MPIYIARCADGTCTTRHGGPDLQEPEHLVASVGEGGVNIATDVRNVQTRLNRVPQGVGGPLAELGVDGSCGIKTKAAILRFQQHYPDLLKDGRIDVDKNTWRKLMLISNAAFPVMTARDAVLPSVPGAADAATQALFVRYLFLTQFRVYEAMKSLDVAKEEVEVCVAHCNLHPGKSFFDAYKFFELKMEELPTVDRCFHLISPGVMAPVTLERIRRIRKVFTDMGEVIIANSITTPAAEIDGSRRYLRVTPQTVLDNAHPDKGKNGVIADAALGGWWQRNANNARIRYGTTFVESTDAFSTLIHEMAHFVSHETTYQIGDQGGYYRAAFSAPRDVALRTAECYSWFALLASLKHLRRLPNNSLPIDI